MCLCVARFFKYQNDQSNIFTSQQRFKFCFFPYLKTSEWLSEEKIRNDIKSHPVGEEEK